MQGITAVAQTHESYPELLKEIADLPALLYVNGSLPARDEKLFAVVGTRKPTAYGREAAMYLTRELCRAGFSIVSGMAIGIDAVAHETALKESAKTYAVLGCGIDVVYPASHKALYRRIAERGGVISEYACGVLPALFQFPQRNRIIAGMSVGTLVIEAKEKSGALITGNLALEYNREVFALPGPIFSPQSRGTNKLIQQGAKLVQDINDILSEFGLEASSVRSRLAEHASDEEKKILAVLESASLHLDEIIKASTLPAANAQSVLTMLEIKDMVQHLGGSVYGIKR